MTDPSEREAFEAYVRDDYQCDDDVHWEEGPGYPDAPFISQDGKYHSLADEVYPAYQRGRSDGQARAALPGRAAAVEAAARLFVKHFDGPCEAARFVALKDALALPASPALPGPSVEAIADAICGAREAWASDKHGNDYPFGTDYNAHLARAVLALFPAAPQAVRAFFEAAKADCAAIKRGGVGMVRANAEKWAAYDAMQEAADAE